MRNIDFRSKTLRRAATFTAAAMFCCGAAFGQEGMHGQTTTPSGDTAPNAAVQQNGSQSTVNQLPPTGDPANSMTDKLFLKKAMEGSMAEVQLGQLALTKTSDNQIKQFAQKMIDDHTKLLKFTETVAKQNGVAIPSGPNKKDAATMAKLQALSGPDFDKAYVKDMLKDHKADDNDFKMEAQNAEIPNVKILATRGEPVIASHLQMIEQISKSMNVGM